MAVGEESGSVRSVENGDVAPTHSDRKTVLWTCCGAHAVQDGLSAAIYVLLPILAETFGLNYGTVGLLKSLKSLAQGLLEILSGIAAELVSERHLLVFGLAVAGAGYILLSTANGPKTILACLLIVGIGGAFQHALSSALVSRAFSNTWRRGALGLYNSSGDTGKLAYTACFSLAVGAGIAWRSIALAFGIAAIAAAIAVYLSLRSLSPANSGNQVTDSQTEPPDRKIGWGIMNRQGFAVLLLVVFLDSAVQAGALTFIAFVFLAKGVPLHIASFAAACILFGGMFGKAFCGFLAERIGVRPAFTLVQALTAVGIVAVIFLPYRAAFLLLPFLGAVLQGSTSITYGMVDDLIHRSRIPRGFALIYASSSFASVVAPVSVGLIGDASGITVAMLTMAGLSVLAIVPCWLFGFQTGPVPGK